MCDTIIKENLSKKEIPQYVYKRVQKVGNGKYITPVMGEPLYKGSWKGAKSYPRPLGILFNKGLIGLLKKTLKFKLAYFHSSSMWTEHHAGMWGSFKHLKDARNTSLVSNFTDEKDRFPTIIVKCEIRGNVKSSKYLCDPTYLSSQIRVVEEVEVLS